MKHWYRAPLKLRGRGWLILLFFAVILAVQSPLQVSESKKNCEVEYINERLTVNVDNVALGSVLAAIREKTGVEFVLSQEESERLISIRFESFPLVEGLRRILNPFNFALLLDPGNKPMKVVILGYAKLDSSPPLRELTATARVQRVISPSSEETSNVQPATEERMVISFPSRGMNISQPAGEDQISTHSIEKMVTKPSSVEDLGIPVIHPPPIEGIPIIPTPPIEGIPIIPTPPIEGIPITPSPPIEGTITTLSLKAGSQSQP